MFHGCLCLETFEEKGPSVKVKEVTSTGIQKELFPKRTNDGKLFRHRPDSKYSGLPD